MSKWLLKWLVSISTRRLLPLFYSRRLRTGSFMFVQFVLDFYVSKNPQKFSDTLPSLYDIIQQFFTLDVTVILF